MITRKPTPEMVWVLCYNGLLQYEKNVKIIAPIGVREKLIDKAKGILNLYKEDIIND